MVTAAAGLGGRALGARAYMEVFESLPNAVVVVDGTGRVAAHNPAARGLFGARFDRPALRCCDLVGCGRNGDQRSVRRSLPFGRGG